MKFLIIINVILFLLVLYLTVLLIEPFKKPENEVLQTQDTLRITDIIPFYTEIDSVKLIFISDDYQNYIVWHNKEGERFEKEKHYIINLYSIFNECKKSNDSFDQLGFCEGKYILLLYQNSKKYEFHYDTYDYIHYINNDNIIEFRISSTLLYFYHLRKLSCKYK